MPDLEGCWRGVEQATWVTRACASRGPQAAVEHRPGQCAAGPAQATGAARQSPSQLGPSGLRLSAACCLLPRQGPSSKRTDLAAALLLFHPNPHLSTLQCPSNQNSRSSIGWQPSLAHLSTRPSCFYSSSSPLQGQLKSAGSSWKSKVNTASQSLPDPASLSWELPSPVGRHAAACAA